MPIEIKELTIKINVTTNLNEKDTKQEADKISPLAKKQIVKECVEVVIGILEDKLNR